MSKIRINDLAKELEVKSKAILDALTEVGVTEKKTHSSSLEEHEADKVRRHLRGSAESASSARSARAARTEVEGIKTKIDLSNISKPGDVLKAIISKQQPVAPAAAPPRPVAVNPPAAVETKATAPAAPAPVSAPVAPATAPRMIVPTQVERRTFTVPQAAPPQAVETPAASSPSAPVAAAPPTRHRKFKRDDSTTRRTGCAQTRSLRLPSGRLFSPA